MKICVDTTVLIDILKDEFKEFQDLVYSAIKKGENLSAPSVVYAELMPGFDGNVKLLNSFLKEHKINIEPLDADSVTLGAKKWLKYLESKPMAKCPGGGCRLSNKEHFISDFYIGGYAASKCRAILTRDRGIYKKYFPELPYYKG